MYTLLVFIVLYLAEAKIHRDLLASRDETHSILISMKHCPTRALAEVSFELDKLDHVHEKAQFIRRHLSTHAEQSQAVAHRILRELKDHHAGDPTSFWITNQIHVANATRHLIEQLAAVEQVEMIQQDRMIASISHKQGAISTSSYAWGIHQVNVDAVWDKGNHGRGSIAGFIDSGLLPSHQELMGKRILAWKDVVSGQSTAYDDLYHGTHITATATGNNVGIAKDANIVACKAFNSAGMLSSAVAECAEFMICPNGRCEDTPHVIGNSWSFTNSWDNSFEKYTRIWQEAGIVAIASTGNNYNPQTCYALELMPPSTFDHVISVGSTNQQGALSRFSRQGSFKFPSKPDLTAPGENIVSAANTGNDAYTIHSGTSMAVPHVVGAVLLMVAEAKRYDRVLTVSQVRSILRSTATRALPPPEFPCNYNGQFPNTAYGAGRLDVQKAVQKVQQICTR